MAGSLGYADRLKNKRRLGGQLGAQEYVEDVATVKDKVQQLADMITQAKDPKVFLFTGAGISTSTGIPDFRGPNGIWTLKKKKLPITAPLTPFEHAKPSFTHMVISSMVAAGVANMVCSQNVDCLHLRSGVPRARLAELHGNCFAERCAACKAERVRDFQVETINFRPTGRACDGPGCGGAMVDNVLDWDSALPDDELDASVEAAAVAGVCLVLGSSLQISPANEIPLVTVDHKGKLAIINMQKTPRDRRAALLLRAHVDAAMALLSLQLGLTVQPYVRLEGVAVCHAPPPPPATAAQPHTAPANSEAPAQPSADAASHQQQQQQRIKEEEAQEQGGSSAPGGGAWGFHLMVRSVQGERCSMPMVQAVSLRVAPLGASSERPAGCTTVRVLRVGVPPPPPPAPAAKPRPGAQQADNEQQQQSDGGAPPPVPPPQAAQDEAQHGGAAASGEGAEAMARCARVEGGVPVGGPYVFSVEGLPASVPRAACHVTLHLAVSADEDKRTVRLPPHVVEAAAALDGARASGFAGDERVALRLQAAGEAAGVALLPAQAPAALLREMGYVAAEAGGPPGSNGHSEVKKEEEGGGALLAGRGAQPRLLASAPEDGLSLFTFVSQHVAHDAAAVWAAYEASPPPVVLPAAAQPKRKRQPEAEAGGAAAGGGAAVGADGQPLRRSARRGQQGQRQQQQQEDGQQGVGREEEEGAGDEGDE